MKRVLIALAVGGAIFGTVFAFAASLGLSANDLAAGDQIVAACSGGNSGSVTYTTTYSNAGTGGYVVNSVVVSGLGTGCNGETASATLTGDTGTTCATTASGTTSIGSGSSTVSGSSATISITQTPLACNVAHIYVVVSGTSTPVSSAIVRVEPIRLGA